MYNQTIADYIKAQKVRGVPKPAIKHALVSTGWQQADVDATLQQLNGAESLSSPKPSEDSELSSQSPDFNPATVLGNQGGIDGAQTLENEPSLAEAPQNASSQLSQQQYQNGAVSGAAQPVSGRPQNHFGNNDSPWQAGSDSDARPQSFGDNLINPQPFYISNPFLVLLVAIRQPMKSWRGMALLSFILAVLAGITLPYVLGLMFVLSFGVALGFAGQGGWVLALLFLGALLLACTIAALVWVLFSRIALKAALTKGAINISFKEVLKATLGVVLGVIISMLLFIAPQILVSFLMPVIGDAIIIVSVLMVPVSIYIAIHFTKVLSLLPFHLFYEKQSLKRSVKYVRGASKGHAAEIIGFLAVIQLASMIFVTLFGAMSSSAIGPFEINRFMFGLSVFVSYFPMLLVIGLAAFGSAYRYISLRQLETGRVAAVPTHPLNYVMITVAVVVVIAVNYFSSSL